MIYFDQSIIMRREYMVLHIIILKKNKLYVKRYINEKNMIKKYIYFINEDNQDNTDPEFLNIKQVFDVQKKINRKKF